MYAKYFGLAEMPFRITPDPRFLWYSDQHQEAKQKIIYHINESVGPIYLLAEIGTGKTTIAINLASFINTHGGQRNDEVVLVDLDVEEPNCKLFLNLDLVNEEEKFRQVPQWIEEKCTFCGKCQSTCQFNAIAQLPGKLFIYPELCHSYFACSD